MTTSVDRFGNRMIELLPQMIRGFAERESNYLSRGKITLPQLWVLEHLSRREACPMNELARFLRVSRPAVTGMADRMIAQGLISRQDDPHDRRIVRVRLTAKGHQILKTIWDQKRRMLVDVFGKISPSRREQYLAILEQVVQILNSPRSRS